MFLVRGRSITLRASPSSNNRGGGALTFALIERAKDDPCRTARRLRYFPAYFGAGSGFSADRD